MQTVVSLAEWADARVTYAWEAFHDLANSTVDTAVEPGTTRIVILAEISSIQTAATANRRTTHNIITTWSQVLQVSKALFIAPESTQLRSVSCQSPISEHFLEYPRPSWVETSRIRRYEHVKDLSRDPVLRSGPVEPIYWSVPCWKTVIQTWQSLECECVYCRARHLRTGVWLTN